MRIAIETILHSRQRIPGQVGDWQWGKDNLLIRISETGNWRHDAAIAVHELVEALLCRADGVDEAAVDAFDMAYEERRRGGLKQLSEPGDDPAAPYARQHCFATAVERMLIAAFGLSWDEYEAAVEALP